MKIKHWQGYGIVEAKKLQKSTTPDGKTFLEILVYGNHEYGLERKDAFDLKRWLIDKFDKDARNISAYDIQYRTESGYKKNDEGLDEEFCKYTFVYWNN